MDFPFNPKNLCKILAHECNNQNYGHSNCPAGDPVRCPFKAEVGHVDCEDNTWKDWRDFFKKEWNHEN